MKYSKAMIVGILTVMVSLAFGQEQHADKFDTSSCVGCHGTNGMGGLGPPIAATQIPELRFYDVVRKGKGMMPPTHIEELSDKDLKSIYLELKQKPWISEEIPISYKVGALLTTKNVGRIFLAVFAFSFVFAIYGMICWFRLAGFKYLKPAIMKFGIFRAFKIAITSLLFDGLFVRSLWKKSKHRWFMHGLMLYGMIGLALADILIQIYNPTRAHSELSDPLKILPITAGIMVLVGVIFVMIRYKKDEFIDNGLTLGRDYLFVTLLFHTVISGIFTLAINRSTSHGWVMPIYLYHLVSISALIISAPFTRFQHAWIVPMMVALTKVTEAITKGQVDIGLQREPSPGRHHKSLRIANDVMKKALKEPGENVVLRYFP